MNSIKQLISAILLITSNEYNNKTCSIQTEIHLKYPNTTYTRWLLFLVMV